MTIRTRNLLQDTAKGIGIILVVYGHTWRGINEALPAFSPPFLSLLDFLIYTTHMPLFFLLAGYNASASLAHHGTKNFLGRKVYSIIYPYFLWSILQLSLQMLMGGAVNHPVTAANFLTLLWLPSGQFWFFYVLLLCHLTLLMEKLSPIAIILTAIFLLLVQQSAPGILVAYAAHFAFFGIGYVLANRRIVISHSLISHPVTIISCLAVIFTGITVTWKLGHPAVSLLTFPISLSGITLMLAFAQLTIRLPVGKWLGSLGRLTMPIFVMHVTAAAATRIILIHLGVTNLYVLLAMGVFFGLLLPCVAWYICKRLKMLNILGLTGQSPWTPQRAGA